jgi:hypothetical protein
MTDQPFDPFALWRDMLSKWETSVNDLGNRNMASPEFSRFMNQAMGASVRMRHGVGEVMQRYLETMNMPSRADIVALGERLQGIEEQVARLNASLAQLAGSMPNAAMSTAGPPRTKLPKPNGSRLHSAGAQAAIEAPAASITKAKSAPKRSRRAKKGKAP